MKELLAIVFVFIILFSVWLAPLAGNNYAAYALSATITRTKSGLLAQTH